MTAEQLSWILVYYGTLDTILLLFIIYLISKGTNMIEIILFVILWQFSQVVLDWLRARQP